MALSLTKVACGSNAVAARRPARATRVVVRATDRTLWLPGTKPPAHLDGKLAGDFGFDPLGLGLDKGRLAWYTEAEKTNGRWAMAAVAGIMGQELLGVPVKWYEAGQADYDFPIVAQVPLVFLVSGFLETKRYQGFKETGTSGLINSFPFDPAGMNSADMAVKEIKNGRLAMIAFVGFCIQAIVTRTTPIEDLKKHLADPFGHNLFGYLTHLPEVAAGTF